VELTHVANHHIFFSSPETSSRPAKSSPSFPREIQSKNLKNPPKILRRPHYQKIIKNHHVAVPVLPMKIHVYRRRSEIKLQKKKPKKCPKNTPLASPASERDLLDSGAVVDHGYLSESLQFSLSSSLSLPLPSPSLCENKKREKKERPPWEKGEEGRKKKRKMKRKVKRGRGKIRKSKNKRDN